MCVSAEVREPRCECIKFRAQRVVKEPEELLVYAIIHYSTQPNITQKSLCIITKAPTQWRKAYETQTTKQNSLNSCDPPHLNANHITDATHQS